MQHEYIPLKVKMEQFCAESVPFRESPRSKVEIDLSGAGIEPSAVKIVLFGASNVLLEAESEVHNRSFPLSARTQPIGTFLVIAEPKGSMTTCEGKDIRAKIGLDTGSTFNPENLLNFPQTKLLQEAQVGFAMADLFFQKSIESPKPTQKLGPIKNSLKMEQLPIIITPIEAYELALDDLKAFEEEWNAFVSEDARRLSVFDEEENSDL